VAGDRAYDKYSWISQRVTRLTTIRVTRGIGWRGRDDVSRLIGQVR
jgi:hypothetical protein